MARRPSAELKKTIMTSGPRQVAFKKVSWPEILIAMACDLKIRGSSKNSGNFFIIQMLIRLAYQNYIVSMAKHVAHIIHYPKLIAGQ